MVFRTQLSRNSNNFQVVRGTANYGKIGESRARTFNKPGWVSA
jgi:hypothetical protein